MSRSNHSKCTNPISTRRYSKVIAHGDAEMGCPKAKRTTKLLRRRADRRDRKAIRIEE